MKIGIAIAAPEAAQAVRRTLAPAPGMELLWMTDQGQEALALCQARPPDLLLMGLTLADMDCAEATRRIMTTRPCPILLVCGDIKEDYGRVYEALGNGAQDAADLPGLDTAGKPINAADLLRRINTLGTLSGHSIGFPRRGAPLQQWETPKQKLPPLVVVGASTGGPKALSALLEALPADFPAAVVVVQHLDAPLAEGLAALLDRHSPLRVAPLTRPSRLVAGQVWLAATTGHVILDDGLNLGFTQEPAETSCHPSVDVFFHSVARHRGLRGCGVLLTGMGRDGAAGLLALRKTGFYTIAQDEASSVVFGMPKAAAELGGACAVLPLPAIADRLIERVRLLLADTPG